MAEGQSTGGWTSKVKKGLKTPAPKKKKEAEDSETTGTKPAPILHIPRVLSLKREPMTVSLGVRKIETLSQRKRDLGQRVEAMELA
jgi:hypothetical protein